MPDSVGGNGGARPRVVAIVGPFGSGKTTLCDALLAAAGAPAARPGERAGRGPGLRIASCSFMGDRWTLLDCSGSVEFFHDAECALAVADLAVVVCEPAPEKAAAVGPLLRALQQQDVPHLLFINKIDAMQGRVRDTLAALQHWSPKKLVLRQIPIRDGERITGYVDLASERGYHYQKGAASKPVAVPAGAQEREREARTELLETLADHDDALLEKILEDIPPTGDEVYRDLHKDLAEGTIVPVLLGAGEAAHGVRRLWKALRHDAPDPAETEARRGIAAEGGPLLQVFRTVHAGHSGKISYARVWRGQLADGANLEGQRLAGLYRFENGAPVKAASAGPGEIVGLGRLERVATGATIGGPALPWPAPPPPVYALAIAAEDRKDEVKLHGALQRLAEEDPCITVVHDPESSATVLHGQGEMHLLAAAERLRAAGLKVAVAPPRIPFRETIRRSVQQHARLKRQTGGHGQFADVTLEVAPLARGEGFRFASRVVGGAVPKQYVPAVGEAAEDALAQGAARAARGGRGGRAGRRHVPCRGQLRHGVPDRDPDGDAGRPGQGRPGAARADRPGVHQRSRRLHAERPAPRHRPARPHSGLRSADGLARLGRRGGADPGRRAAGADHRPALADHGPRHLPPRLRPPGRNAARSVMT